MAKFSVVVPVYNSEKSLNELYIRLSKVFDEELKRPFELILVDDSSKDGSFRVMKELCKKDNRVVGIQLAKNCGQHPALLCGFRYSTGDFIITMDDDLQHPPEEIHKLVAAIDNNDDVDVVIGKYVSKKHSVIRNLGTKLSNYVSYKVYHKPKELELTSFRIMRRFVVDDLLSLSVSLPRIGNMILQVNNKIENVIVEHDSRKYGKSGYTFTRLVRDLINNIITNSIFPLIVVRDLGLGCFLLSAFLGVLFLIKYFIKGTSIVGWTSSILLETFFSGLLLFGIGVIGEYLMRILDESKKMPNYFVRKVVREKGDCE